MAEPVLDDGPIAGYFAAVHGAGGGAPPEGEPVRAAPAVSVREAFAAFLGAIRTYFQPHDDEVLPESEYERAYNVAWGADDGATSFAEVFKYTIATSFLLTPTLSISMYGDDQDTRPLSGARSDAREGGRYTTYSAISGQPPRMLFHIAVGLCTLAAIVHVKQLVQILVKMHVAFLLLAIVVVELIRMAGPDFLLVLRGERRLECFVSRPPSQTRPRYLAAGVPPPAWVADERVRLQMRALRLVKDLVKAAHAMDKSINAMLAAIQEVEVVARGYSLSSPLPPISRIEGASSSPELEKDYAPWQGPWVLPAPSSRTSPQRLTPLRKALSEHVEQASFHCMNAQQRLAPLARTSELGIIQELQERQAALDKRESLSPVCTPGERPSASLTPRTLALFSHATPPRRAPKFQPMSPVPMHGRAMLPTSTSETFSVGDELAESVGSADEAEEPLRRKLPKRNDRLALSQLRVRFEQMHTARVATLYYLLALDFSMQPKKGMPLDVYWDEIVIHDVLQPFVHLFSEIGRQMDAQLQTAMGLPHDPVHAESATSLHKHLGLADRMTEMGRMLRTIQCKLQVCAEDVSVAPLPALHGTLLAPEKSDKSVQTLFDSMRHDLLALSNEWEAGLRIIQAGHAPPAPAPAPVGLDQTRESGHEIPDEPNEATETKSLYASTETEQDTTLSDLLLHATSPAHLPPIGSEEVYEGEAPAPAIRTALPRAERIRLMHEERARAAEAQNESPTAMVSELKGVLAHRRPTAPAS